MLQPDAFGTRLDQYSVLAENRPFVSTEADLDRSNFSALNHRDSGRTDMEVLAFPLWVVKGRGCCHVTIEIRESSP